MGRLRLFHHVGGNFDHVELRAQLFVAPHDGIHGNEIDDAFEFGFGADRKLNDQRLRAETVDHHLDAVLKSAPMRSILLTKQMRGTLYLSA